MADDLVTDIGTQNQAQAVSSPVEQVPQEKLVRQSVVDNAIKHAKNEAYDRAMRDFEARKVAENQPAQPQAQQQNADSSGQKPLTIDDLNNHLENMRRQSVGKELENQFLSKLDTEKAKDPGFEEKVTPLVKDMYDKPQEYGMLVHMINSMDNTAAIIKHLSGNENDLSNLLGLSQKSPNMALKGLQKLSNSIKLNQVSVQNDQANTVKEPLSRTKPSPNVSTDNGKQTIRDWRRSDFLRG